MFKIKQFLYASLACVLCLLLAVGIKSGAVCKLSALPGRRVFFLDSASSQALVKTQLSIADLGRVKGECVYVDLQAYEGGRYEMKEEIVRGILNRYQAKLLFTEGTDGACSYYAYTPLFAEGLSLQGVRINLHVAISQTQCAVGTPIIFGGF